MSPPFGVWCYVHQAVGGLCTGKDATVPHICHVSANLKQNVFDLQVIQGIVPYRSLVLPINIGIFHWRPTGSLQKNWQENGKYDGIQNGFNDNCYASRWTIVFDVRQKGTCIRH
ncbi:hypothetical protein NC651_012033 [Populus alba x Populus x berolinensis]|nr:hypothetical protein NC651_012033 [Populus alba x Populus x berolinensis]